MENNHKELSAALITAAMALDTSPTIADDSHNGHAPTPHPELIDFNLLCTNLRAAAEELGKMHDHDRECDFVRQWFLDRITALRRARRAVLSEKKQSNGAESYDKMSLPQLLRQFEEESARLRSTASGYNAGNADRPLQKADAYRPYKS